MSESTPNSTELLPNDDLRNLLKTKQDSDFIVRCERKFFYVHKFVLTQRSEHFRAATEGGFRESLEASMTIEEFRPCVLAVVLAWLYSSGQETLEAVIRIVKKGGLPINFTKPEHQYLYSMHGAVEVYQLADYLALQDLKIAAQQRMGDLLFEARGFLRNGGSRPDFDKLEDYMRCIYEILPETDDLARRTLTTSILGDPAVYHRLPISENDDNSFVRLFILAQEHDPEGVDMQLRLLARFRRDDCLQQHVRPTAAFYYHTDL
jgi:hypothetical protein